jgi:hypothetical protein
VPRQSRQLLLGQCNLNTYTAARYQVEFGTDRGDKLRISGMPYVSKIEIYGVSNLGRPRDISRVHYVESVIDSLDVATVTITHLFTHIT